MHGKVESKNNFLKNSQYRKLVVLEKTLDDPLGCKEIQPVHPRGNQSWIFIGRTDTETETPVLWPPDANLLEKTLLPGRIGEGSGTPLQYSCLENPMDGGAW